MGKLRFARTTHRGCAEGRSPFDKGLGRATVTFVLCCAKRVQGYFPAEGLGVSPNSSISPKSGGQGVEFNSWVSPNPLGGAARVADEAPGECLERAAVGCAFALPTLRFGRVQGFVPAEGLGVSPNSSTSPKSGGPMGLMYCVL